ncbi:hypothetical protein A0J61_02480 [Choanephora cucurbitarum]|uniref:Uncharacterized protein n=1 Tax=Choanephora cucurbitarum TaxID=101091 RepID=A0A1C7NJY8_9FUNG|nr:hypothetical protein A0J61_02480 [Choanephora cucurbitarum]
MRLPSIANLLIDLPPSHYGIPPIQGDDPPQPLRLPLCFDRQTQSVSPPLYNDDFHCSKRRRSISSLPSTQIIFDDAGQPKLKRKRGRPPTVQLDGSWTFLAPTVWNIPISRREHRDRQTTDDTDTIMTNAMAAFTSSKMDMVLPMPHKKRGRKPKTHLVGNSCFVWKDLTLTRSKKTV